jgi:molybdopterin converting factor small subunit
MTVTVGYSGQARAAAGRAREIVELADRATVEVLLAELVNRYGDAMGAVAPALLVFVGEEQVGREVALTDGADVMLLSPIAGG